ncbi:type II toxin-antitoxin system death-on-curing family toxin [Persicobacter sp. CCB-QB2]|uniref:type II toxin-antitoxin system death-on-curing family toxin n=1 Tax=Persicobacter sp. CCB-QB2 TaxID=1561025 RepID=UPI0006A991F1|nr:type II toxin-antitoxin system death-on-curing family toxin [Persicobacter sp. CCB-QB2]
MVNSYITKEELLLLHHKSIKRFGGLDGIKSPEHEGLIDSCLSHIQNDDYYPDLESKSVHLYWSLIKNHCFEDGNKRIALRAVTFFWLKNGIEYDVANSFIKQHGISLTEGIAAGKFEKNQVFSIIQDFLKS